MSGSYDHILNALPTPAEREEHKSAAVLIHEMNQEFQRLLSVTPEGKQLIVTMQAPDGRSMDVERIRPTGFSSFQAVGYIGGVQCYVLGHISRLAVFCAYETVKAGQHRAGFTLSQPPPESEPQEPEK